MKKVLLFACCVAAMLTAQAQPTVTSSWTKSQTGILSVANADNSNPMAISAQGDVYATGIFTEGFAFGGQELEAISNSAYLLKYGADGAEMWGIALTGAATIKAVTTDEAGNVYIAGNFADLLTFGSTDGNTQEKEGVKMEGAFIPNQAAGFVAKYDANGALKAVQSFVPEALPELAGNENYFPEAGSLCFNINKLVYDNGKLYASAIYTGLVQNNGHSFKGSYQDPWGGVFFIDLASGAVFSMDDEMNVDNMVATLSVPEPQIDQQMFVRSASFAIADGKLYSGFVAIGNQTLTIGSQAQKLEMYMSAEGETEYGHILSVIDLATGASSLTKKYSTTHDVGNYCYIESMEVKDDVLMIGGTFNTKLAFDSNKEAVSSSDLYLAVLNKNTLDVNATAVSNVNEGEQNQKNEEFGAMAVCGNYVYMVGYTADATSHAAETPLAFWIDTTNGTITQANPANLLTGTAASGTKLAIAQTRVADETLENSFSLNEVSGVTGLHAAKQEAGVTAYPNPVVDVLNFTTPCDVTVINLMGMTVKQQANVSTLNVSDLINGQYIIKLTTEQGTSTVKIIKQ